MAQTAQQLATIFGVSVKKYFESQADSTEKLAEAKTYADGLIAALTQVQVVDGLTSTSTTSALSASQGKILKGYFDNLNTLMQSDNTALDNLQEIVDFVETNRASLDAMGISNISGLQAALNAKEPSFTKNTAFNKNFGTAAGTVAQGNDSRINGAVQGSITQAQSDAAFNPA